MDEGESVCVFVSQNGAKNIYEDDFGENESGGIEETCVGTFPDRTDEEGFGGKSVFVLFKECVETLCEILQSWFSGRSSANDMRQLDV